MTRMGFDDSDLGVSELPVREKKLSEVSVEMLVPPVAWKTFIPSSRKVSIYRRL